MHECAINRNENHLEDLISKKSLIATIEKEAGMNIPEWLRDTIMNAPSAVVRCNDCKHWNLQVGNVKGDGLGSCDFHNVNFVTGEGFCYWAEGENDGEVRN